MFNAMYSTLTQIISSPRQFVVAVLLFLSLVQFKTHNILCFKKLSGGRGNGGGGGGGAILRQRNEQALQECGRN